MTHLYQQLLNPHSNNVPSNQLPLPSTTLTKPNNKTSIHSIYGAHPHNRLSTIRLMQQAMNRAMPLNKKIRLHIDGGTNRSITNDHSLLLQFRNIKPYHMSTAGGDTDITCTGLGYLPWRSPAGCTILIKCYYSSQAVILSLII